MQRKHFVRNRIGAVIITLAAISGVLYVDTRGQDMLYEPSLEQCLDDVNKLATKNGQVRLDGKLLSRNWVPEIGSIGNAHDVFIPIQTNLVQCLKVEADILGDL
jgi:hypothetical protein